MQLALVSFFNLWVPFGVSYSTHGRHSEHHSPVVLQSFVIFCVTLLPASLKGCQQTLSLSDTRVTTRWAHRNSLAEKGSAMLGKGILGTGGVVCQAKSSEGLRKGSAEPFTKLGRSSPRGWEELSTAPIPSLPVPWITNFLILFPPLFQRRRAVREPLALSQSKLSQESGWVLVRGNHFRQNLGWLGRTMGNRLSSSDWTKMGFGTHKGCERHQVGQRVLGCLRTRTHIFQLNITGKEPKSWPLSSAQCKPKDTKWKEWGDLVQWHTLDVNMLRSALQDVWIWPHPSPKCSHSIIQLLWSELCSLSLIPYSRLGLWSIPMPQSYSNPFENQANSLNLTFHNKNATA